MKNRVLIPVISLIALLSCWIWRPAHEAPRSYYIGRIEAAEGGNADAQYHLGLHHHFGDQSVSKDGEEAMRWYRKAAEQGHPKATLNLGQAYGRGWGVPKDQEEAAVWYRKAAEQGNKIAQYELATFLDPIRPVGQGKDGEEAVMWYRKAADQGDVQALESLGRIYSDSRYQEVRDAVGIVENYVTAYALYSLSAFCDDNPGRQFGAEYRDRLVQKMSPQQLPRAQSAYQDLLKEFKEKKQKALLDEKELRAAGEKALVGKAEGGDSKAQLALGWLIYNAWSEQERGLSRGAGDPVGIPGDAEEALQWWRKAADQGDSEARYILGVLSDRSRDGEEPLPEIKEPPARR